MIKKESRYIIRRIIIGVGISLVLMLIRSLPVNAASCDSETITKGYYDGSTWTNFTVNPITFNPSVYAISIKFSNNNIQNKAIIKNTTSSIVLFGNHVENPTIEVRLRNSNTYQNITSKCSNNITHSCSLYNDNLCIATIYNINTSCNFTSTDSSANAIEIIYRGQGIERFYNSNNCLQINPTDTQQIIESQNNNTDNIIENMNDNADQNHNDLNDIENAIEELFPNFGSCRRMGHVILTKNKALDSSGNEVDNNNYGISGMIRVYPTDTLDRMKPSADNVYACFYGNMNQLIECQTERQVINYQIPPDAYYVRFTWSQIDDSPETYHCSKDDQMVQNAIDEAADSINKFREDYNNSQKVCNNITYSNVKTTGVYLNSSGVITSSINWGITDYITINGFIITRIENLDSHSGVYACLYDKNKTKTRCIAEYTSETVDYNDTEKYIIFSINKNSNRPQYTLCQNGNQGMYQFLSDTNIGNSGVGFFDNFSPGNMHGLGNIVALPLDFVSSLNNTCQPIEFPSIDMYSYHFQLTIPCLSSFVYDSLPSALIDILRLLINGFIVYRILKWLFDFIIELRDPDYDELEVMDL